MFLAIANLAKLYFYNVDILCASDKKNYFVFSFLGYASCDGEQPQDDQRTAYRRGHHPGKDQFQMSSFNEYLAKEIYLF